MKQALKKLLAILPREESRIEPQDFPYTSPPSDLFTRTGIDVCGSYKFPKGKNAFEYSAWLRRKYPLALNNILPAEISADFTQLLELNPELAALVTQQDDVEMMRHIMWGASSLFTPQDIGWFAIGGQDMNNVAYELPGYTDLFLRLYDGLEEFGGIPWPPHPSTLLSVYEQAKDKGLIDNPYIDSYAVSLKSKHHLQEN